VISCLGSKRSTTELYPLVFGWVVFYFETAATSRKGTFMRDNIIKPLF
jgi:hypothetical protein